MDIFALLGGFLATAATIGGLVWYLRRRLRRFSSQVFGNADILEALADLDPGAEETPRSLSGCDSLLLPQILRDFPDYDPVMAKTYLREYLHKKFSFKEGYTFYNIVIARYLPSAVQKTVVYQAALSWLESGRRCQRRYELHYTYLLGGKNTTVAANCPNCGGALGYGETQCAYCGSRVTNVLGNTWKVTQCEER